MTSTNEADGRPSVSRSVDADSPAAQAGLRAGDRIESLGGRPLLSIADLQYALHVAPSAASLSAVVARDDETVNLTLELPSGWRAKSDLSWRPTSWDLRRLAFGGILFKELSDDDRKALKLPVDALALRAEHVGEYGDHAKAKQAGFKKGDVLVEFAGSRAARSETQLMAANLTERKPGDKVAVKVLRDGREIELQMPVQ